MAKKFEGLTQSQVEQLIHENKKNYVKKTVGKSYWSIIVDNVLTAFNLIGLVVFVLLAITGDWGNTFFFIVILANTFIGIIQEIRAKLMVQKLSIMTAPTVTAIRDGVEGNIAIDNIVLGDIIVLTNGKQIPADSEVLDGFIETNEALLTGESRPVRKDCGDTLLSGSFVVSGKCVARVIHVGADNYVEQLAIKAKKYKKPKSELMRSISGIIKIIAIAVFPLGFASFLVSYLGNNLPWQEALARACGSMIGMIPSGMVLLTSVTLAVSVIKMVGKHTLVQDLYCIEMLARVNTLCLDKTGTITDGTMKVEKVDKFADVDVEKIVASMLYATKDNNDTAKALKKEFVYGELLQYKEMSPFSSDRKMSAVTFDNGETYALGATEFLLNNNQHINHLVEEYSSYGMRTLLLARVDDLKLANPRAIALIVLSDNIREDAYDIIKWFVDNDVKIKIISGDNAQTVSVIAGKVGVENADKYISLDKMTDEEVIKASKIYTVFGRVSPEQKALLVSTFKNNGDTVAMTGDGVNDILAMKQADCAISVASGSDSARSVAHLVLLDNKFSSMPSVVREGRQVVNNIQNASSLFLMKTIMTMFTTILMLILCKVYPLMPQHLYVLEFCVIGIPAFFLALRQNSALIRGKFLDNILFSTLPKGIALALSVVLVYIFSGLVGAVSQNTITLLVMLNITYSGLVGLIALCVPFSLISMLVAGGSILLSTGAFWLFDSVLNFGLSTLTIQQILFVALSVIVSTIVIIMGRIIENKHIKGELTWKNS